MLISKETRSGKRCNNFQSNPKTSDIQSHALSKKIIKVNTIFRILKGSKIGGCV